MKKAKIEEGANFYPKFNEDGLIPCVVTSNKTGRVLMLAYMNEESLNLSIQTSEAHYWSRSRQELWHKGATSGNVQTITAMRTDCDQDCIWIEVTMPLNDKGQEVSCHTGREGCFYRDIQMSNNTKNSPLKFNS